MAGVTRCEGLKKPGHHPGEPLPPGGGGGEGAGSPLGVMGRSLLAGWRDALNPQRSPPWAVMFLCSLATGIPPQSLKAPHIPSSSI